MKNIFILITLLMCAKAFSIDSMSLSSGLSEAQEITAQQESLIFDLKMESDLEGVGTQGSGLEDLEQTLLDSYSAKDMIRYALDNRLDYNLGDRIKFLDAKAQEIVKISGDIEDEKFLRITLNRTREMARLTLGIMGKTHQETVRFIANFYKEGFELAYSVVNDNTFLSDRDMDLFLKEGTNVTSAEFGRMMTLRMWSYSSGLQADASKAVFLVKLVQYLGADLAGDLRVREPVIAKSLADVIALKKGRVYKNVLVNLQRNKIPSSEDLASLRKEIWRLIRNMNQRF